MRILIIALLFLFAIPQPVSAAFIMPANTSAQAKVSDTASAHHLLRSHEAMHEWASHRWWYQKRGLGTIAAISGLLGLVAAVGFFVVLPVSVSSAVVLAIATTVLGGVAFSFGEMGMLSAHPHHIASIIGMVTGVIELIPAYIPLTAIFLLYDLIRMRGHKKHKHT